MPPEGRTILDYVSTKYGSTAEQLAERQVQIRARRGGWIRVRPRTHIYNTFDAHRVLQWAGTQGKKLPLKLALLKAYHGAGKDPSNHDVIVEAAQSAGLDGAEARRILESDAYADEVRAEVAQFQSMGINSVPSVIFDNRYLLTGGQPPEAFEQVIREVLEKRQS
jgi:predicted DsbA family dithiol-disulfide isomerase